MVGWTFSGKNKNDYIVSQKRFNYNLSEGTIFNIVNIKTGFVITKGDTAQDIANVLRLTAENLQLGKSGIVLSKATQELRKQSCDLNDYG